jgi:hypothetical protein
MLDKWLAGHQIDQSFQSIASALLFPVVRSSRCGCKHREQRVKQLMAITLQQQRIVRQYAAPDSARVLEICKNVCEC